MEMGEGMGCTASSQTSEQYMCNGLDSHTRQELGI